MADQGTNAKARGRIDCHYQRSDGVTERWSLIQFDNFETQYDARSGAWQSKGMAIGNTRPPKGYPMELGYHELNRILTINVNGYQFTLDQGTAMVSKYTDRSTLNIKILHDSEGINAAGDSFIIKGNSRLDVSL